MEMVGELRLRRQFNASVSVGKDQWCYLSQTGRRSEASAQLVVSGSPSAQVYSQCQILEDLQI